MNRARAGETIVVWFSCGAASAVAAYETIKLYGLSCNVRIINNPVVEEHEDNQRFLRDVETWLGLPIETALNPKYPEHSATRIWSKRKFMAGPQGAPCTIELKKKARLHFESTNHVDWHVLGFTADEVVRSDRFMLGERSNLLTVLIDAKLTKADCFRVLQEAGIKRPAVYDLGYPNANCIGCVKASSPTYWNHVRKMHPQIFEARARQSRELGARLVRVKNRRVFLDELKVSDKGRPMKGMDFDCGIFCEEKGV